MSIVIRVTPGTVDVSDAAQWLWKHVEDKTVIKFANTDFDTCLWLMPRMINELLENGKK